MDVCLNCVKILYWYLINHIDIGCTLVNKKVVVTN